MCGIAGFWAFKPVADANALGIAMQDSLKHRGPDTQARWINDEDGICLVHARLAVIDVSETGAQPMHSHCGRYAVTYNGEIYNHNEIRELVNKEDPSVRWRGSSDTETLLVAISLWGFERTLLELTGMYAIALWDKQDKSLSLARDRMGEKPLYYGWINDCFVFGSEIKAIRAHPDFIPSVNRDALRLYIENATVPSPHCIYNGLYKLPPANTVSITRVNELPAPTQYWSIDTAIATHGVESSASDVQRSLEQLEQQLSQSVEMQMASDVPLGAFLSGGYDSSLVVALMQKASSQKVKTFSIGFDDPSYDEAPFARQVAEHLGTEHRELYVSAEDIRNLIPRLPVIWDEPFADSSQLPTHIVSAMTREHVTVALSGDGGDELFGGYTRYQKSLNIWGKIRRIPSPLRRIIGDYLAPLMQRMLQRIHSINSVSHSVWIARLAKLNRYAQLTGSASKEQLYQRMIGQYGAADALVRSEARGLKRGENQIPLHEHTSAERHPLDPDSSDSSDFLQHMVYTDLHAYLPDTILTKVDRAAMAVGLETRAPLLDHHLVELAWSLPADLKVRDGKSKWCLKSIVHNYIPQSLMERPKKGFGIPLADWLRGPLKDWAEALLSSERLEKEGYFNPQAIRGLWNAHLSGNWNNEYLLWNILMFQMWLDTNVQRSAEVE